MKLTVFQSDKGDCLLLTGKDGRKVLADGGMSTSYREHVAEALSKLKKLDVVYVSHIDQDHISGVLKMMDDLVAWRVYDYQKQNGGNVKKPNFPRPPEVGRIWNNAFHDVIKKNAGEISDLLAANAALLQDVSKLEGVAELRNIATGVGEAIRLSHRLDEKQLGIPINPEYDGKLMLVLQDADAIRVGGMRFHVLAPFEEDLDNLREDWNEWLRANKEQLTKIRQKARDDEDKLTSQVDWYLAPLAAQTDELGRREKVTPPNLASLMFLVEEGQKSLLLTGDGHWQDIIDGLDQVGRLDADGKFHANVLKVQHHGSENNINEDFCNAVTADNYVFCGNGAHGNPDLRVVKLIVKSRLAGAGPNRRFKLWFNSSSAETPAKNKAHMRKLEKLVEELANGDDRVDFEFMVRGASHFTLEI